MSLISDEQKIIDGLKHCYSENISSMKEVSYNQANQRDFIEINCDVLHIDKVFATLSNGSKISNCFSTDTIILDESNSTLYLIEFKEQWPKNKEPKHTIRLKCYDTLSKLCLFWINNLNFDREDFFRLKFKYCLITRPTKGNDKYPVSFLNALDLSSQCFKLKILEKTFVEETKILVSPNQIHQFLSRITKNGQMIYHHTDKSTEIFQ